MNRKDLFEAQTVSDFLKRVLAQGGLRPLTYASLGRLSGMKSRSHPREVILGKKRLSLEGAYKISRGLKLPDDLREFFLLLTERELANINLDRLRIIEEKLEWARERGFKRPPPLLDPESFFSLMDASLIYASLGKNGASLETLERKTLLNREILKAALQSLSEGGFILARRGQYFPSDRHLSFSKIKPGGSFQKYYSHRVNQLKKKAAKEFSSETQLFWETTFSVASKDLPKLKEDLRQTILRFAENAETSEGDSLRSLTLGFFDPREGLFSR